METDALKELPKRSPLLVDLDSGWMSVEDSEVQTSGLSSPDEILARYLAFVYHLRNLPVGTPIGFRVLDLEVLSTALEIDKIDIESRLKRLIKDKKLVAEMQRRSRVRTLAPLAGVVLAVCSAGLLVASFGAAPEPEADVATAAVVSLDIVTDIGAGGAIAIAPGVETQLGGAAIEINPES
jgi:uncharacterized membrane protein